MSLSGILDTARSSLSVTADRTAIAARNVAHASDPSATRKIVQLVTESGGAPRVASIIRSTSQDLQSAVISAQSDAARQDVLVAALDRLDVVLGDPQSASSPAGQIGRFKAAMQSYSAAPADISRAGTVLSSAQDVVAVLHSSAALVEQVRREADQDIHAAAGQLNTMLRRVEELNTKIINGTRSGADVTDELDARDQVVADIAREVGVTVISRSDNGIALLTDSGLTLFDVRARAVSVQDTPLLPGTPGGALLIDGIAATGSTSVMAITTGRLAGLVEIRDGMALTYGAQLDEIARGLILTFAESDQGPTPAWPDAAGLFYVPGFSTLPVSGAWQAGLASEIAINPNVDPARGGDLLSLRDGGISEPGNPAYIYNTTGVSGFTGRIDDLIDALDRSIDFDARGLIAQSASVADFSSQSVGWLQGERQATSSGAEYARALLQRSQDALAKVAGISIDDEMTQLLELERTYQASSKLIAAVDSMFDALMQAVR